MITGVEVRLRGTRGDKLPERHCDFLERYERQHGSVHVPFFQGSFSQARAEAKRKSALLVACFVSRFHECTPGFLRRVIGDPALAKDYERDNVLFWIADVYHGEEYACTTSEGFSIMDSLVALSYEVCEYPSLLFLAHVSHRLVPLELVTGMIRAAELLEKTHELQAALLIHEEAQRERTDERSAAQRIRDEQDAAYRRSLEADAKKEAERKRAEKLQEEEQARERALAEQQDRRKRERQSLIARLQRDLPAECDASDAIRLSLQLLDGKRVIRKWAPANTVEQLYDWAFVLIGAEDLEITRDNFTIRPMLPPMPFARSDRSLKEAGIQHQMKLIVVLNDVEEDE